MTDLCDDAKQAIVTHLAQFRSPAETAKIVSQDFGVVVDRFQVRTYDPTNPRCACGERLRYLFAEVRRKFISECQSVPAFNQGYRLGMLQRQIERADISGNIKLVAELLAQAAKEAGGAYGKAQFPPDGFELRPILSPAEARSRLTSILEKLSHKAGKNDAIEPSAQSA